MNDAVYQVIEQDWGFPEIGETFYVTIKGTANFTGKLKVYLADDRQEAGYFSKVADANGEFDVVSGVPFEAVTVLVVTNNSVSTITYGSVIEGQKVEGGLTEAKLVLLCAPDVISGDDGYRPPLTITTTEFTVLWEPPVDDIETPTALTYKGASDVAADGFKYQGLIKATDVTTPAGFCLVLK